MKIEYIKEILEYYDISENIIIDESDSNSLILMNKSEIYDVTEFLTEKYISTPKLDESYDSFKLVFNPEYMNKTLNEIKSYYELRLNLNENELYQALLKNDEYDAILNRKGIYENNIGTNTLNDYIMKFHSNHKNFYTFILNESYTDAYELFYELINESDLFKEFKYVLYENLDELYASFNLNEFHTIFRNFNVNITDESNILIDYNHEKHEIRNITESDYIKMMKYLIKSKFYYDKYEIDYNKLDEFIELLNTFSDYNSYEILSNNEYNIKYINNKLLINFNSFEKYSNNDEFILIKYNESNKNISINSDELVKISDELLNSIIDASLYYELDSYEFKEFRKVLKLL